MGYTVLGFERDFRSRCTKGPGLAGEGGRNARRSAAAGTRPPVEPPGPGGPGRQQGVSSRTAVASPDDPGAGWGDTSCRRGRTGRARGGERVGQEHADADHRGTDGPRRWGRRPAATPRLLPTVAPAVGQAHHCRTLRALRAGLRSRPGGRTGLTRRPPAGAAVREVPRVPRRGDLRRHATEAQPGAGARAPAPAPAPGRALLGLRLGYLPSVLVYGRAAQAGRAGAPPSAGQSGAAGWGTAGRGGGRTRARRSGVRV